MDFDSPHSVAFTSASCPRCGYDQRGEISSWQEQCPLAGTCAECGLEWKWGDMMSAGWRVPVWCIEGSAGWLDGARRSVRTALMFLRPFRFWEGLRMEHAPRPIAIWIFLGWFLVLWYAVVALSSGNTAWRMLQFTPAPNSDKLVTSAYATVLPFSKRPPLWVQPSGYPQWSPASYTIPGLGIGIHNIRSVGTALLVGDSTMLPWAYGLKALIWIVLFGSMTLFGLLSFAVTPISRIQAKVKTAHLVRIGLYSMVPIGLVIILSHSAGILMSMKISYWIVMKVVTTSVFWYPAFLAIWWSAAARNYLHMRHAWALGIIFAMVGFLATLLIAAVLTMLFHG